VVEATPDQHHYNEQKQILMVHIDGTL